ncbi:putative sporulation protein YtxC [Clostridium felsineum]|uniref:putative sporulation protein YtxC n=1 Tax=Clostridium felsineum TaxID=36839 RepID=UPI00098CD549|nr:putative sporulation protein YtxC [Clostridium felsineum]URZ16943.1 hypothetical protein CLFE_029900 [Clostridium felsineum DSM 794]
MLIKTIVVKDKINYVISSIEEIKESLHKDNINIGICESMEEDTHFIKVMCNNYEYDHSVKIKFNRYFAKVLYDIMAIDFCMMSLNDILEESYFFLDIDEMSEIREVCVGEILKDNNINDEEIFYINKKNKILEKINECLEEYDEVNITGFVRFRMKFIEANLKIIIDKVIERYMIEKEYDEFVKLLKYFVDMQESKIEIVNIYVLETGEYKLTDVKGEDITDKVMNEFSGAKSKKGINEDDILISGLITACPQKIIIYDADKFQNKEILNTIENVFENKVIFCSEITMGRT